jgi:hypothetical protein
MQQMFNIFTLLPGYLIFLALFLVILPTVLAILLRFSLYNHLSRLRGKTRKLLGGIKLESTPQIITQLEQRFRDSNDDHEQINTSAIIEGTYSQERFYFFGMSLNCEFIERLCQILPNLLLSFGLLGTFLGITFNLASLSQTITQVDLNDVKNLVEELDQPLRGMGVAFISSLIAISCSALLTVINSTWNTSLAKTNILTAIEDYIDNIFLPMTHPSNSMEEAIDRFSDNFQQMLQRLGTTIEESVSRSFGKIQNSAATFDRAANTLDSSNFPDKLAAATNNLAIAQNQFSQSSLILQRSTQAFEHNLNSIQQLTRKFLDLNQEISSINQKYHTLIQLNREKNLIEESNLREIQQELARLVNKMQTM